MNWTGGSSFMHPQTFDMPDGRVLLLGWMGTMEKEKRRSFTYTQRRLGTPLEYTKRASDKCRGESHAVTR